MVKTHARFNDIILNKTLMSIAEAFVVLNADCQAGRLIKNPNKKELFRLKAEKAKSIINSYIDHLSEVDYWVTNKLAL